MAYRTILVHVDTSDAAPARIELAAELARREGAHLVGAALTGVPRYMGAGSPFDLSGQFVADYMRRAEEQADQALARFEQVVARFEVPHEQLRANDDAYIGLCQPARYADLVVLGQTPHGRDGKDNPAPDLPQHMILHCGRPVLMVPVKGQFATLGQRCMIAWNGSLEAARAVTAALPLLTTAHHTTIVLFGPQRDGKEPGADIARYLSRYGVNAEVKQCAEATDAGHAILSEADKLQADLLVMGAYGHSRFRELILGGATRIVLNDMSLPVLMSH